MSEKFSKEKLQELGIDAADNNLFEPAISFFERALKIDPDDAFLWYRKYSAHYNIKQYEESLKCIDRAISLKIEYWGYWFYKGQVLKKMNRYNEAISVFDKSLDLINRDSDDFITMYCMVLRYKGMTLSLSKKNEQALECFDEAIQYDSEDRFSFFEKSKIHYIKGEYEKVLDSLKNYFDNEYTDLFDPNFLSAIFLIAYTFKNIGIDDQYKKYIHDLIEYLSDEDDIYNIDYIINQIEKNLKSLRNQYLEKRLRELRKMFEKKNE